MSKRRFKDYSQFRILLLENGIKTQGEFSKFIGLGRAAVSERFSNKQEWKLKELLFMARKFNKTIDELCSMLDISA